MKKIFYFLIIIVVLLGIFYLILSFYNLKNQKQNFMEFELNDKKLKLLIARNEQEWKKGLSGIYELSDYDGMIFLFPKKEIRRFWNKDTHLDLLVYWLDADKIIGQGYLPSIEKTKDILEIISPAPVNKVIEIKNEIKD